MFRTNGVTTGIVTLMLKKRDDILRSMPDFLWQRDGCPTPMQWEASPHVDAPGNWIPLVGVNQAIVQERVKLLPYGYVVLEQSI
jgi:hypothetical protein